MLRVNEDPENDTMLCKKVCDMDLIVAGETPPPHHFTWHRAEGAFRVDSRLNGDDSLSLRTPSLLALSFYLEQV